MRDFKRAFDVPGAPSSFGRAGGALPKGGQVDSPLVYWSNGVKKEA
ncbi:hypothetical protein [Lawsonibacter faecis]|uniref:Uncharacterized protein n=1 Tax=Lawsonibacter faecis TaxID=2763052 RepID=A0A8J6JCL9_9FIRM|nr:hypothetical protein [Lawsonibacter faecis]MBC5737026.1 hypothetical protein [Lawsonibacter faecis]